jgi:acyl carrier protein phosphodiesterase
MNYLAHLYLSGESEKLLVGNFIGDYVKGNAFQQYPDEIARGILLHRRIDSFTDMHSCHKQARDLFRKDFGLYSGIVVDFCYDHFLASNWSSYSEFNLSWFAKRAHAILLAHFRYLPVRVQGFLPFLIQNKRLESYASVDGIIQSLHIMGKYSSLPSKSAMAKKVLKENYTFLDENFKRFMQELQAFVDEQLSLKKPALPKA